jgi:hypothetical protein
LLVGLSFEVVHPDHVSFFASQVTDQPFHFVGVIEIGFVRRVLFYRFDRVAQPGRGLVLE